MTGKTIKREAFQDILRPINHFRSSWSISCLELEVKRLHIRET